MEPNQEQKNQNETDLAEIVHTIEGVGEAPAVQAQSEEASPSDTQQSVRPQLVGVFVIACLMLGAAGAFLIADTVGEARVSAQAAAVSTIDKSAFDAVTLHAASAFVFDMQTGDVLYEKNADAQLPLASITKVPLVLVATEVLPLEGVVTVSREAVMRGEGGGLGTGEMWKVSDLIDFTLIASSNSGAEVLAEASDEALRLRYSEAPEGSAAVWRMNKLAQELGLSHTYFLNPSGLDMSATQAGAYSSARETAQILAYAATMRRDLFAASARPHADLAPENGSARDAQNTNDALPNIPGLILGKTGYTDLAGGNLGVVFDAGLAHPIAVVVLGSTQEERFNDVTALVEATLSTLSWK